MGNTKEPKVPLKQRLAENNQKIKENFSKFGKSVKKALERKDKSAAQTQYANTFDVSVTDVKNLRKVLPHVRTLAKEMFIIDDSNVKTGVDPDAFAEYNCQIMGLRNEFIRIQNEINAGVGTLQEKESRSESLKTLNTLNQILTRIIDILTRIYEVSLSSGEIYSKQLVNELRMLLALLNLLMKNIKSISKKHAVFGGPALEQLTDLRAILNLFVSDFTEMIVTINNTMQSISRPKSFKYSTKLGDGTRVGVKSISGDVGQVVANKRDLGSKSIITQLEDAGTITSGADRAAKLQDILRGTETRLQQKYEYLMSKSNPVRRPTLVTAEKENYNYLEHQMRLVNKLENFYNTTEYPDPTEFGNRLAKMSGKGENLEKKLRESLGKFSRNMKKTSQYSSVIEILDSVAQSVDDMVNAVGLDIPEPPAEEQTESSDKEKNNDENNETNDKDRPDDPDNTGGATPTDSDDRAGEDRPAPRQRVADRRNISDVDARADYLYKIITDQEQPPRNMTRYGAYKELKKLAIKNQHACELRDKYKLLPKTNTFDQTRPRLGFENQTVYEKSPQGLPPAIYRRGTSAWPPTEETRSRRTSDTSNSSVSSVARSTRRRAQRRYSSGDTPGSDVMSALPSRDPRENSIRELTNILDQPIDFQNTVQQNQAMEKLKELANNDQAARLALSRYTLNGLHQQKWSQAKSQIDQAISTLRAGGCSRMVASDIIKHLQEMSVKFGGYATRMYDKAKQINDDLAYADIEDGRASYDDGASTLPDLEKLDAVLKEHLDDDNNKDLKLALRQLKAKANDKKDPEYDGAKKLLEFHGMGKESDMEAWLSARRLLATHWTNIENGADSDIRSDSNTAQTSFQALQRLASELGGYAKFVCHQAASMFDMKSETDLNHRSMHSSANRQPDSDSDASFQTPTTNTHWTIDAQTVIDVTPPLTDAQEDQAWNDFVENLRPDNKNNTGSEKKKEN